MNLWSRVSDYGISEDFTLHEVRSAQLVNRLVFFAGIMCIPYYYFYFTFESKIPLFIALSYLLINISLSYFSKRRQHEITAMIFTVNTCLFLTGLSLCISNSSFQYYLIPVALVPFAVVKSQVWNYILFGFSVLCFFIGATSDYFFEPVVQLPESIELLLYVTNLLAVFTASWYFIMQINKTNSDFEDSISEQKEQIERQHMQLEESFTDIRQSIDYAKRIQSAILPSSQKIKELGEERFVLYQPKDVVAGDFYFMETIKDTQFIAVADCTGHGVPGAMVSVVCNQALNRSIREFDLENTGEILDKTRELVEKELNKSDEEMNDGMDLAFCALKGNELMYSGANNPLWIFRSDEIITLKADKQPVGKYDFGQSFTTQTFKLEKGDFIVMSTDGFADQFGGDKGKKLKSKTFITKLQSISALPAKQQKRELQVFLKAWMGNYEQIDDICVLGFRH